MKFIGKMAVSLIVGLASAGAALADATVFRITLDTPPTHIRNIAVENFVDALRARAGDKLDVQVFHSGQLFKGNDVPKALAQGAVEMGFPVLGRLSRVVPDAGVADLPMFFGRPAKEVYAVLDGPIGGKLNARIEEKMGVHVVGPYLDLGFASLYSTDTPIKSLADLKGLTMRVPGSPAAQARYSRLGVTAVTIGFSDLPVALSQGSVDGLMTTHESVRSSKIYESGIGYSLETRGVFVQYVPLIGAKTWASFDQETQDIITQSWNESIDAARATAAERQESAREELKANGVIVTVPTKEELSEFRADLLSEQAALVEKLRMDANFVAEIADALAD